MPNSGGWNLNRKRGVFAENENIVNKSSSEKSVKDKNAEIRKVMLE